MQAPMTVLKSCDKIPHFLSLRRRFSNQFVPKHEPANPADVLKLEKFLADKHHVLVLTGAGISTESGNFPFSFVIFKLPIKLLSVIFYIKPNRNPRLSFRRCWFICTQQFETCTTFGFYKIATYKATLLGTEFCCLAYILQFSTECHT